MRDFQRSRVYAWERQQSFWPGGADNATPRTMSLDECRALIRRATRRYGESMPQVADGRGTRFAKGSYRRISLPTWARTPAVVLHETAHCLAARRLQDDCHGPVFLRLYIQLLAVYLGLDEGALVKSARAARLKVAGHQPVRGGIVY